MTTLNPRPRSDSLTTSLRVIASGDLTAPQVVVQILTDALGADNYSECIKNLLSHNIDPQSYIDGLDKVCHSFFLPLAILRSHSPRDQAIDILSSESDIHGRCVRALGKVCGIYELLPDSYRIKSTLTTGEHALASGGFSDIWKATNRAGGTFAIKVLRMYQNNATQVKKVR